MSGSIKIPVPKLAGKTMKKINIDIKPLPMVTKARTALQKKYDALGGEATFGQVPSGSALAKIWDFGTQCLVYNAKQDAAFQIIGDIYAKWKELGGSWIPDTDETTTPDGIGRYNHFSDGTASIYWTPDTGAHAIYGDIRKRWSELGWERSGLGYPTSDEDDIDEGGRANSFQHGWIYWWPDTGAIDLGDIVFNYTGFYAYKESDHDQSSGSDEPYCIFTMLAPKKDQPYTLRSKVYGSVDDSSARPDHLEDRGAPARRGHAQDRRRHRGAARSGRRQGRLGIDGAIDQKARDAGDARQRERSQGHQVQARVRHDGPWRGAL